MNIKIKGWSPRNANFKRFYVTADNKDAGFIQTNLESKNYGEGYYANHRAAKGDNGNEATSNYKIEGDTELLEKIIAKVREEGKDLMLCLNEYACNTMRVEYGSGKMSKNKKTLTIQ